MFIITKSSPILLCGLVLVLLMILFCTEEGSSTNQSLRLEQDQTVEIPRLAPVNEVNLNKN